MKVTKRGLREMIQKTVKSALLGEELAKSEATGDDELMSYLDKMDKILSDSRKKLADLIEEGRTLSLKDNTDKKNRSATLTVVVGALQKIHGILVGSVDFLKKNTG